VSTSFAAEFRQNMHNAHASVRSSTSRAAKTQKNYFGKHVKGPPFALNQLVWLYWRRPLLRNRSRKLTRSWTGPWCIVEFKTTIVVVVQNVKTHKKQTVYVERLVPCRGRLHDEAEETVVPPSTRPRRNPRRPARLQDYDLPISLHCHILRLSASFSLRNDLQKPHHHFARRIDGFLFRCGCGR